jgi:putative transposase
VKYAAVEAEKAAFPVEKMCKWLGASRSGYYEWLRREESARTVSDRALNVHVAAIYKAHHRRYGSPRIHRELHAQGHHVSRKRVARLMQKAALKARAARRWIATTDSRGTTAPAPNLLRRAFAVSQPNQVWVGDVTYLPSKMGWLYLATLLDLGSRRVVGWALTETNDTALIVTALRRALAIRKQPPRIHHSDRGSPYASAEYQRVLSLHNVKPSMSRKGDCWDNAVAESFFATLKCELDVPEGAFASLQEAIRAVGDYIDGYYNRVRRHSTLDYASPIEYERRAA